MLEASGSQDREPKPLLQSLQSVWETRNMNKLKQEMEVGFSALDDPWTWLLEALEVCGGWRGKGPSLGALLVKGLQQWCTKHPEGQPSGLKLRKLQARLFPLLAECHANLLDPLIDIYHLHAADRDFLLGHVNHLYHKGKFKEAAVLGIKLELQPDLELEKMCVPLLFQERMDLVEAFVESHPDLQQQLLLLLDTWFAPDFQITDVARKFPGLKPEKVNHRLLNRTVFRFLDKFQLDPALCPNVVNQRHLSTLKYLIYKRFREKTMTEENWTDHVQVTVQGNRWLQEQLVHLLVHHGGLQAAARWGLHYGLPKESLPRSVPEEMERLRQQESREDAPEPARSPGEGRRKAQCYGLPLPREQILFLSTWEALQEHKECLLKAGQIVGLDMEWRPSFGVLGSKPRVSLVQLAVRDRVFLLDMLALLRPEGAQEEEEALDQFFRELFADPNVTKLGYGMHGDLAQLAKSLPTFSAMEKQLCNFLDLLKVHKVIRKGSPGDLQKVDAERSEVRGRRARGLAERGLSLLVQEVLGSPLDKAEQLSDWEKRPLREEQLLYAASDAYCLLEVYAKLLEDPASFGLSPETLAFLMGRTESAEVQQPGGQSAAAGDSPRQEEEEEEDWDPTSVGTPSIPTPVVTPVQDFRVVCDNMLQGLGRHLRCLGVDVRILENADDHRKAAEIARQEGRVILTSGLPYQTLRSQVGEGRCFRVDCAQRAKEQALQVLEHFRVQVTLADIFSRCQACNCNQYLKVSRETMAHLVKVRSHPTGEEGAAPESSPPPATDPGRSTEGPGEGGGPPRLPNGLQLQIEALPPGVLTQEELSCFYCCKSCGKVFWEGSHFGRVVAQLRGALDLPESGGRLYGGPV
nr:PREDICTED: exonuclease mut-7 homolog [Anolis carolinensis]|eukprot:XP_008123065.1 PREDICTED: exonuclease mut-7 homolog [Anolis carolinensis]